MIKFFKPEDFEYDSINFDGMKLIKIDYAINRANAKIEREGLKVIGELVNEYWYMSGNPDSATHKAMLIAIEPIEKCKHENVKWQKGYSGPALPGMPEDAWYEGYKCECGAKLKPTAFEETN